MLHLCYIRIFSISLLESVDFSFDERYSIHFSDSKLVIRRGKNLPPHFWKEGIYSLTAIIGNNGAGKTTVLRFIMNSLVEGANNNDVGAIIVYEEDKKLKVYLPSHTIFPEVAIDSEVEYSVSKKRNIDLLYYSGHFQPYTDPEDGDDFELSGNTLLTDQWLLIKDLQNYMGADSLHMNHPLFSYLYAYHAQNQSRICSLLALDGIETLVPNFQWPQFVIFRPNDSGFRKNNSASPSQKITLPTFVNISNDPYQNYVGIFIYHNIMNAIVENKGDQSELLHLLNEWQSTIKTGDVLDGFERFVNNSILSEGSISLLNSVIVVLRNLFSLCHYSKEDDAFYLSTRTEKDKLKKLSSLVINSEFYLTARFFNIVYSHELFKLSKLSSGEQECLNLLSRLYYGIVLSPRRWGTHTPSLILLDEAEIGFHPDWQRNFINLIINFLQMLSLDVGRDFQVVITSHSPIILSDIPKCCVNFIRKNGDNTIKVEDESETFGENVFNLYRRAFFMDDGLIGSFATGRLENLFNHAMNGTMTQEMMDEIDLIGDKRIKHALEIAVERNNRVVAKNYYQRKLDELNRSNENN